MELHEIAACIACGTMTTVKAVTSGGERQLLPVCDDCLDPRRQKVIMLRAIVEAIDPMTPPDVATALYHSRHRDLLDARIIANIEAARGGAAEETEEGFTIIDGGLLNLEGRDDV